ncbi:MAG: SDR family NAD(P)-dependent oxidoreductase [Oscillospiraceae bacterium]|nr:SDR family NAD(P)-dependent oxidoreductase [Oscillospiraceae bacterium]MCL2278988.1 SDR family NAD(P)-dependent oxidoreductase [Oscillospiraceae bacterium]
MSLDILVEMSRRYGADEDYVLAGGGNTSYKDENVMYVKGSGTALSVITGEQFVAMDLGLLRDIITHEYPSDMSNAEQEAQLHASVMASRLPGEEEKRPSVEAILHAIFPYKFVLHVHPALVNGLTCGKDGESKCKELFNDEVVWVNLTRPGLGLAKVCHGLFEKHEAEFGDSPQIIILKNHGIFVAADTVDEVDMIMEYVFTTLESNVTDAPDFSDVPFDKEAVCAIAPALRMLYSDDGKSVAVFFTNKTAVSFAADEKSMRPLMRPFTPDHIVYYKDEPLFVAYDSDLSSAFSDYEKRKGFKPQIVAVKGLGFFSLGEDIKEAERARLLFLDALKIAAYAKSFGGFSPLPEKFVTFILGWEAEKYRSRAISSGPAPGRLSGKIAVVTGGAQGFGKGIAEAMVKEGAFVAVADLNFDGAKATADELCDAYDAHSAIAVRADVSDEVSVSDMISDVVIAYGGLDILVSNAGVLVAGGLGELSKESFDLVTKVNYTGYFLCTKFACEIMKIQRRFAPAYMTDIVEINSKSGLEGSNKNFAYSGSKFGGVGLTQSFALELAPFGIKVNAVCPGNFLEGPLWSDPNRGLFKQYLDSGKVPGAKSVADVRRFYEAKVPLGRGCEVEDVVRAILYVIEQRYETGQAVPVTGGQVMLS